MQIHRRDNSRDKRSGRLIFCVNLCLRDNSFRHDFWIPTLFIIIIVFREPLCRLRSSAQSSVDCDESKTSWKFRQNSIVPRMGLGNDEHISSQLDSYIVNMFAFRSIYNQPILHISFEFVKFKIRRKKYAFSFILWFPKRANAILMKCKNPKMY